jgi:hypothetical protein
MNGINFSMDGPIMDGTWYNTTTGDSFTVRDTFFQDNQLMVQTTDGRMLDYNTIQNYVQCDSKDIPTNNVQKTNNDIPVEVAELLESPTPQDPYMLDEDMALISGDIVNRNPIPTVTTSNNCIVPNHTGNVGSTVKTEDQRLVERVLSRQQQPSISCNINWTKFPQKQMDVLMDMMGVELEDVCDFYISKIDLNDIRESIKRDIKTYIEIAMGYVEPEVVDPKTSSVFSEVVFTPFDCKESIVELPPLAELEEEKQIQPKKKTTKPAKKTTKKK